MGERKQVSSRPPYEIKYGVVFDHDELLDRKPFMDFVKKLDIDVKEASKLKPHGLANAVMMKLDGHQCAAPNCTRTTYSGAIAYGYNSEGVPVCICVQHESLNTDGKNSLLSFTVMTWGFRTGGNMTIISDYPGPSGG